MVCSPIRFPQSALRTPQSAIVWLCLVLVGCGGSSSGGSGEEAALEPLQIHADADWVRDVSGRVVLLRGANYSGLEFGNFVGNPHGPEESDFAQMASWGVSVVRLPVAWKYLEPSPGVFDVGHLRTE